MYLSFWVNFAKIIHKNNDVFFLQVDKKIKYKIW